MSSESDEMSNPAMWETDEEKLAKDREAKVGFYLNLITTMKKEAEPWQAEVRYAWREYQSQNFQDNFRKLTALEANAYSRYWADTMTILPAIFSRVPQAVAQPECEGDPVARDAAIYLERLAKYVTKRCDYQSKMTTTCLEFLHANRATARLFFEAKFREIKKKIFVQETQTEGQDGQPVTIYVDDNFEEVLQPILFDENGLPYYESETEEEEIADPQIYFEPLFFDQMLISPGARSFSDVWLIAYRITLTRRRAAEVFGSIIERIRVGAQDASQDTEGDSRGKIIQDLFQYWEIWDARSRKVFCVHEDYRTDFLQMKEVEDEDRNEDPYELLNFFPSPRPMICNERYCDLYPTPDFTQTRDLYETLNLLIRRINRISASIKGVLLYDGSSPEIKSLFNELFDGQGIAVSDFKDLMDRGGLDSLVMSPPYDRMAQALQTHLATFQQVKTWIDELRGISDIIRGYSNPETTYGAEKIKKAMAGNRLSLRCREVERFNRDLIEMMCDLALRTFEDAQLQEVMELAYETEERQQRFPQALALLKDCKARKVRIELETDSLVAIDEQEEKQSAMELLSAVGQYFSSSLQTMQSQPYLAPLITKVAETALLSFRHGKHVADELKKAFDDVYKIINQPKPPASPAPDPALLQIESNERIAQQKLQVDLQKTQMDIQLQRMKSDIDAQMEQYKLQLQAAELELKKRMEMFDEQIRVATLNEQVREADLKIREQLMEEERLAQQNVLIPQERMNMAAQLEAQTAPPSPGVVINVGQPQAQQPLVPVMPQLPPTFIG